MSKLFLEILDDKRKEAFNKLVSFKSDGVLGGGTALALQINHRKSFDFDIFVRGMRFEHLWKKIKNVFGKYSYKTLMADDQLDIATKEGIKVTFFYDGSKLIFSTIPSHSIDLMSIRDIACNKALVLGKRPKWRDYVDIYFLLSQKYITLTKLIELSNKKFGNDFSTKLFLEQLVYFEDMREYKIEFIGKEKPVEHIKNYLKSKVSLFKKASLGA